MLASEGLKHTLGYTLYLFKITQASVHHTECKRTTKHKPTFGHVLKLLTVAGYITTTPMYYVCTSDTNVQIGFHRDRREKAAATVKRFWFMHIHSHSTVVVLTQ